MFYVMLVIFSDGSLFGT